jgi:6-phosphogluconate dehydrogenase
VITSSLYERFSSRGQNAFAAKVNAALRNQFGGHAVKSKSKPADPSEMQPAHAE